jgi:hypothetical protein
MFVLVPAAVPAVVVPLVDVVMLYHPRGWGPAAHVDPDAQVNLRRWRRRHVDAGRNCRTAGVPAAPPATVTTDSHDLAAEGGGRHPHIDHRSGVDHRFVDLVDHHVSRPLLVVHRFVVADVPVSAARELELSLRRWLVPVIVGPAQVAVDGLPEVHIGLDHRMGAVESISRTLVFKGRWITHKVVPALHLAVGAGVSGRKVVNVGDPDVAEPFPDLLGQGVLRPVVVAPGFCGGGRSQHGKAYDQRKDSSHGFSWS